jgi:hypothetical protein
MASTSTAQNIFANRAFFNRAQILNLKGRNVEIDNDVPEPPLEPNEYDYIIIGTGAGGAGVLLGLLEKGTGNEKILVIEKGNANTLTFDNQFNNSAGFSNWKEGYTNQKLRNNDLITVDTQPENITLLNGQVLENQTYPILIANTVGGNTSNNAGYWHHQPISTIASFPPNNLENFDLNKWEEHCELTTRKLTNFDRGEYFENSVNDSTTVFGISRIAEMKEKFNNFLTTRFTNTINNFIKRFGFTLPFNDSNLERNESKIMTTTVVFNEGRMGIIAPILRVFNDNNIIYNSQTSEFNNENVRVVTNTDVERLVLNSDFTKALGVLVNNNNNSTVEYKARHKIFVCCGAFDTPKLLAKSNLGKREWYLNNNATNPNTELQSRLDTMGKLWQTPDFWFQGFGYKIDENENEGIRLISTDNTNTNGQGFIFDNNVPPVQFGSVPFTWYAFWETLRNNPLIPFTKTDIKEDYYIFLKWLEETKLTAFDTGLLPSPLTKSIKTYMEEQGYTLEQINQVREGISNTDINKVTFPVMSMLTQYRVYDNKVDYPGGSLNFEPDKFDYENLKADFGWAKLQTNSNFRTSVQQAIDVTRNNILPGLDENNSAFSSFKDIIDNAVERNRYDLLVSGMLAFYSTTTVGIPTVLDPFSYTDNTGKPRTVYVEDKSKIEKPEDASMTLSSGWHYTGTCFDISDKTTGEVLPGLIVADGSSMNGPVKNNSMASISALGVYMASLAIENKNN